jgi:hypothetical protein
MTTEQKAALWDALWSCQRIRMIGAARLGELEFQHIGMEFWSRYPSDKHIDDTRSREHFQQFIETMMPYQPYHCNKCKAEVTRYHNVKDLACRLNGCDGTLVLGALPRTHAEHMEVWIREHDHWDDHPEFWFKDWQHEVANGDTRLSYTEWLRHQATCADEEAEDDAE